MGGELFLGKAGFEFLDELGGTDDFAPEVADNLDCSGIDHCDVGDSATGRVLHGHSTAAFQDFGETLAVMFAPTGILQFFARHRIEHAGFDAVDETTRVRPQREWRNTSGE